MGMKPGQLCEFSDCQKLAVVKGKIGHPLEDRWCCQECHDNPLGIQEKIEIQQLYKKINEKKRFIKEVLQNVRQQIAEHESEVRQVIFDGLKTYKTHPKILLDREMRNGKNDLEEYLNKRRLEVEAPEHLVLGSWACLASPTGSCVYDKINDHLGDCCIFCAAPEERK
jgi:hypothetical protein